MYYIIKEDTLNEIKPTFVTGGLGIDYRDPTETIRHVTHNINDALVFESVEEAEQYLCRGYVVAVQSQDGFSRV